MTANAKRKPKTAKSTGVKQAIPGAGKGGIIPPPETRWKPGQPSPNPHGRPRKLKEFQALVISTLAEDAGGNLTRAQMMIRTMLMKSPTDRIALLEYAFGKVPQPTHELNNDEWRDWLKENGYSDSDIESLADEFASFIRDRRVGAAARGEVEAEPIAASPDASRPPD